MVYTQLEHRFRKNRTVGLVFLLVFIPVIIITSNRPGFFSTQASQSTIAVAFLIGLIVSFIGEGILLNTERGKYKHYISLLFFKLGFWKDYTPYSDIVVLRTKEKFLSPSEEGEELYTKGETKYEVYLASPNHLQLILIKVLYSLADAEHEAHDLGSKMGKEWVQYNPGGLRPRKVFGGLKV